jgi:hypothetical protein
MPVSDTFVIAGGGLAGAKAAEALRGQGFGGQIVLAAEEDIRPYERPPLSKGYLQGKAGRETIFVHYFYTDQYDLGMEYAGYAGPGGYDRVVFRGDAGKREFIAFWLSGGRVVAGMNVNIWDVNDAIGDLIRSGQAVDPGRLADPAVPPDEVTAAHEGRSS